MLPVRIPTPLKGLLDSISALLLSLIIPTKLVLDTWKLATGWSRDWLVRSDRIPFVRALVAVANFMSGFFMEVESILSPRLNVYEEKHKSYRRNEVYERPSRRAMHSTARLCIADFERNNQKR